MSFRLFLSPHETTGYDLCDKAVINPNPEPRHQFSELFREVPLTRGLGSLMTGIVKVTRRIVTVLVGWNLPSVASLYRNRLAGCDMVLVFHVPVSFLGG